MSSLVEFHWAYITEAWKPTLSEKKQEFCLYSISGPVVDLIMSHNPGWNLYFYKNCAAVLVIFDALPSNISGKTGYVV